jgi:hypothetical protein
MIRAYTPFYYSALSHAVPYEAGLSLAKRLAPQLFQLSQISSFRQQNLSFLDKTDSFVCKNGPSGGKNEAFIGANNLLVGKIYYDDFERPAFFERFFVEYHDVIAFSPIAVPFQKRLKCFASTKMYTGTRLFCLSPIPRQLLMHALSAASFPVLIFPLRIIGEQSILRREKDRKFHCKSNTRKP